MPGSGKDTRASSARGGVVLPGQRPRSDGSEVLRLAPVFVSVAFLAQRLQVVQAVGATVGSRHDVVGAVGNRAAWLSLPARAARRELACSRGPPGLVAGRML